MRRVRIASRGSKLALVQSNYVAVLLRQIDEGVEISIVEVSTKGDRDKSDFLYKSESVGFFTSEVENALLENRADLAVHSLKDLPTAITPGLVVAAVPTRESVADALVASGGVDSIGALAAGATVGTSSLRRIAQLRHIRRDLKCVALRGNVETRVGKVTTGEVDAIVVAAAGLKRLGLGEKISAVLQPEEFLPAPAQGALAVQIRRGDSELAGLVGQINDEGSRVTAETERHILAAMHGGCSIPLGAYSRIEGERITVDAMICDVEGRQYIRLSRTGQVGQAKMIAEELAEELLARGGREILEEIRQSRDHQGG